MLEYTMKKNTRLSFRNLVFLSIALVSLLAWPGIFPPALLAQPAGTDPVLGFSASYTCTPTAVAAFDSRVHVRCSAAAPGGIFYFAVSTVDSGRASRYLSVFTTAKITGKNLVIFYNPNDLSGGAWGCATSDCRNISGAEVQQ